MIRISNNNYLMIFFMNIVLVLVGNKSDKFDEEKVSEEEAENYAKKIGAFYVLDKVGSGIKKISIRND